MVGEVPSGWKVAKFDQVASVERGLTYSNEQECGSTDVDAVCVLRIPNVQNQRFVANDLKYIKGVSDRQIGKYSVPNGSILMVGSNGNADRVGNCCFVESTERYLFASFLMRVVPDHESSDPRYFYYLLAGGDVQGAITDAVAGTTGLKNISLEMLRAYSLVLPPLPEQQKIAAILSSVDEAIQATQAVIDQTRRVKEGLLQDLLTRGLPGHTRFKQTEIGEIPEGWEVATGRELARKGDLVGGPFGSDLGAADYVQVGVPVIRGGNVGLGKFIESDFVYVSPDKARLLRRNSAQRGDLIMTQRGASLGEATLPPDGAMFDSYVISQTMMRLRPNSQVVDPLFLIQSICSDRAQSWLKSRAIGNAQPHLNLSIWQDMPVAIPPKKEQIQIASIVASLDDAMAASGKEVAALTSLKSGLLADLLTGKVRVTP